MTIDDQLIESLLYEQEGVELDLKSEQYRFTMASDDEKSELLKDMLAFANAWRRADALVLIGVKEEKGGRHQVLGISELLDDAAIQQFVNSKTNRPLTFSYGSFTVEGRKIAVIHIPVQQRPVYLKKDYGRLKAETVYVRRGSSTAIASIDEISRMGLQSQQVHGEPNLQVCFSEPKTRRILSDERSLYSLVLDTSGMTSIPDYRLEKRHPLETTFFQANSSYYRELVHFHRISKLVSPLHLAILNSGTATAHDVRLELRIDKSNGLVAAMDSYDYPGVPRSEYGTLNLSNRIRPRDPITYDTEVNDIGDFWVVEARTDKVQSKATCWFHDPFFVGGFESREVIMDITLFSDELQMPVQQKLLVKIQAERKTVDLDAVLELEAERFKASAEYQRLVQKHNMKDEEQ